MTTLKNKGIHKKSKQDRLAIIHKGLDFKKNKEKYKGTTWRSLNIELGKPYATGDSFRDAVKNYQQSLRVNGSAQHEDALPTASTDDTKLLELKKERAKFSSLRLDLNKTIRETARTELLYEEVLEAIKRLDSKNYVKPVFKKLQAQAPDKAFLLAFGDVHYGKKFGSLTNDYDINIAYNNFNNLYNQLLVEIKENKISTLHVTSLGDLIEGMTLRVSQLQALQIGLVDQTMQFMLFLGTWLEKLSEVVKIKYYSVKSSNHPQVRPFNSKSNEFPLEDMERIIGVFLENKFAKNDRVNIVLNEAKPDYYGINHTMFEIFNYSIIAIHGHESIVKKNIGGILKDLSWKYRKFFDYALIGHFHQNGIIQAGEGETNNCEIIRVPSMMGTDDFADSLLVGSKAGASLIMFTSKQGKRRVDDLIVN